MYRARRLRKNTMIRDLIRENQLSVNDFIYPVFVVEGENIKHEIASMPGQYHYSLDRLDEVCQEMVDCDLKSILLFGIPEHKDCHGTEAYNPNGIVQNAIRQIKKNYPQLYVIADVCMCEYTDHGHCGILDENGYVDNDKTLEYLSKIALSYANAGVDMIAPSDMMDGHISSLRKSLDENGYVTLPIMGYSAKYASNYYGPFREAAHSAPGFGDRKTYQMDYANEKMALREIEADIEEGVDIIMVKPALAFLDIVKQASQRYDLPLCVYNVSGEYSMLKMAVEKGLMKEDVIEETLISMKRAGADIIITYFALELAKKWSQK